MKNKNTYQDCPNCWGYQEYITNQNKENKKEDNVENKPVKLFSISGTSIEESDLLYK